MQSGTPNPSADPRNPDPSAAVSRRVFDDKAIRRALMRISHEILERNEDPNGLYLVAIPNGGVPLARQLRANLGDRQTVSPSGSGRPLARQQAVTVFASRLPAKRQGSTVGEPLAGTARAPRPEPGSRSR